MFQIQPLSDGLKIKTVLAFIILAMFILNACGKRKPPLPPVERVAQKIDISGFQRGSQVILSWKMPARNASDDSLLNITRADIYRLAEKTGSLPPLSEDDFVSGSTIIASLSIRPDDFGLKKLTYTDTLEFANQSVILRYAVRFVNKSGQKAGFSNFLLIEPTAGVADAPQKLSAQATQGAVILSWAKPVANVDGSTPPNLSGYNIYRSNSKNDTAVLINGNLVTETKFADKKFTFGSSYVYFVRSVSLGTNGEMVESTESNIAEIVPKDIFPPSAPAAITIAASPNSLSIFFAVNPEADIAGYRVYRTEDPETDKRLWQLLTPAAIKTNTFQDKTVEAGKTYYYYLVAVDGAGNTSEPSEVFKDKAL